MKLDAAQVATRALTDKNGDGAIHQDLQQPENALATPELASCCAVSKRPRDVRHKVGEESCKAKERERRPLASAVL